MAASSDAQKMSEVDGSLDSLVEKASVPNLAALFQTAKDKGLIKPGKEYGNST